MDYIQDLSKIQLKTPRLLLKVPLDGDFERLGEVVTNGIQNPDEPHFQDEGLYNKTPEEMQKDYRICF